MSTITSISTEGSGVKNSYWTTEEKLYSRSANKFLFLSTGKKGQMNSAKGKKKKKKFRNMLFFQID